ncbi:hypothetical protein [Carboxylicivirga marina]|uniref:hypothetical protein n=1 Tax=Carboxylicivirga marina TaxID=2800988 RepID=UPI0025981FA1|nr:hypothetical protein [uncultured Carboxylicivirga sp.]
MKKRLNHNENINDQLIKDLFKDFKLEQAPGTLKVQTMDKVFNHWTETSINYKPIINKNNRWWMIGGFAALLSISFLVDSSVIIEYWKQLNADSAYIDMDSLSKQMGSISLSFKNIPSIVYFTIVGIFALLGIDRFFNRLANI